MLAEGRRNIDMGKLTTHVLDTAAGIPARGLKIELHRLDAMAAPYLLATIHTNTDGRAPAPLLESETLHAGRYYALTFSCRCVFPGDGRRIAGARVSR